VTGRNILTKLVLNNYRKNCSLKVIVPSGLENDVTLPNLSFIGVKNVKLSFMEFHNHVYQGHPQPSNYIHSSADLHETVIFINNGMKLTHSGSDIIQMKHMGNIEIGENVTIGPYNTIVRATLDTTWIGDGVRIASHCNIAHNVTIGDNTVLTTHVSLAGSSFIGDNCFLGVGSLVCDHRIITNNVMLGAGAVVSRDITEPGVYVGCPARKIGEYSGDF